MLSLLALKTEKAAPVKQNQMSLETMASIIVQDLKSNGLIGSPEILTNALTYRSIIGKISSSGYKKYHLKFERMGNEVGIAFDVAGYVSNRFEMRFPSNVTKTMIRKALEPLRSQIENVV